ncbi:uncharacterized protein [Magallana gigas]|uniref:uncharacterized protein isoform X17 n=1 Tax=Magallana gigas TaxID=29159 RepID=UPI003341F74C
MISYGPAEAEQTQGQLHGTPRARKGTNQYDKEPKYAESILPIGSQTNSPYRPLLHHRKYPDAAGGSLYERGVHSHGGHCAAHRG